MSSPESGDDVRALQRAGSASTISAMRAHARGDGNEADAHNRTASRFYKALGIIVAGGGIGLIAALYAA